MLMIVLCFCATVAKVVKRECVLLVTGTRDWWLKMRYTNPNAGTCASHPLPSPKDKCEEKKKQNKTKKLTLELSAASNETDYGKLWFEHSKASFRMLFIFFFRKRKMCSVGSRERMSISHGYLPLQWETTRNVDTVYFYWARDDTGSS